MLMGTASVRMVHRILGHSAHRGIIGGLGFHGMPFVPCFREWFIPSSASGEHTDRGPAGAVKGCELSGGESQRIKLCKELTRTSGKSTVYLLDEPTTGLHFDDISKLLKILDRLVDAGNTVLVIEHNMEVIKTADHIIDLGPEGGNKGGRIIATGTPEDIAASEKSYTGKFLKQSLGERVGK